MPKLVERAVWPALVVLVTAAALAVPAPAHAETSLLASQLVTGVNRVRSEAGLPLLTETADLDAVAFERSADMASRQYFSHVTPEGRTVFLMLAERGIAYRAAGENLAWNTADEATASSIALQSFLNSPPHRANLLNPSFSQIGIGVSSDGKRTYFTLVFIG